MEIEVFALEGNYVGIANGFGEAKRMQQAALPEELKPLYAGIAPSGAPLFYSEFITPELEEKYFPKTSEPH